ncbi:MAG: acetyl-CoA hydrolase/transferase C-terminal domain-containing protein [Caulobacteraceae bacterium]|nr:acetyl-CoA hydrolase/transferase C-terminal domain-containing protein [Caulobacteraceae bacterium]
MIRGGMSDLLDQLKPGLSVYLPGATGESLALRAALAADPERAAGVRFVSCLVPGMNDFDYAALTPSTRCTTFLMPPAMRASLEAGRVRLLPLPYSEIAEHLAARAEIDVAVFHLAPPDADGLCSVGIAADFAPLVWPRARRRIVLVNRSMPVPPRSPRLPLAEADLVVEIDGPVIKAGAGGAEAAETIAMAERVAALVPDGAAIQFGIGGAPAAVLARLTDRKGLTIRSGMAIDAVQALAEAGALARGGAHVAGVAFGSAGLYRFLAESDLVAFADSRVTHGAASLATVERFVSINSALEVDLFGQANLEWRGDRVVSGVGGAPDFVRAARRSPGGRSIIALASTAGGARISRIVPRLASPTVSISRSDVDTVVTEHGAAALADLSLDERAEALIAIAHPDHRAGLADDWARLRARF